AGEIGAASDAVTGHELEAGITVEHTGKRYAHHGHRRVVGPAEAPPHLETRFLLLGIIRHARRARRMQPDRLVELRHGGEDRLECFFVPRPAGRIGGDLHPRRREPPYWPPPPFAPSPALR